MAENESQGGCPYCGDPNCTPMSVAELLQHIQDMPLRVIKHDDERYINFTDLGRLLSALTGVQVTALSEEGGELVEAVLMAFNANVYQKLTHEQSMVDPTAPNQVPTEWLQQGSENEARSEGES